MKRLLAACSGIVLSIACSSSQQPPAPQQLGAAGAPATGALSCGLGQQACYCPDGTQMGFQLCSPTTGLSECNCLTPMASQAGAAAPPPAMQVDKVCAQLQGSASCDARSYRSAELPASILFVLDRSGSMACNAPPVQSVESCNMTPIAADPKLPSRWQISVDALGKMFAGLENNNAGVGLSFFSVDNACGVNSTPSVGIHTVTKPQLDALNAAMHGIQPRGGTPIAGAVTLAYAHLHEEAKAPGKRFVVLLTDGEESCGRNGKEEDKADLLAARKHLLEAEVQKARLVNIRTFVIGAPGSENARGFLSELAFAGGTARKADCMHGNPDSNSGDCHYDLTGSGDFAKVLSDALAEISGRSLNCEYPTPAGAAISSSKNINVQITASKDGSAPMCLPLDTRPCDAGANGFQFAKLPDGSDDLSRVVLCGAACDQVRQDPGAKVDVILGCDAVLL